MATEKTAKFISGWIVEYANDPKYKGLDVYLSITDWYKKEAKLAHSLNECSIFKTRDSALKWARLFQDLAGKGHSIPEIRPIWEIKTFTLKNPGHE